ncbi:MAG: arginine--tRNA ligase [Candidatus Raymondbacteria bacterium RifOxyA12_full_50_37]|uniref:Arginine--tRNA ligase n=1 Tax=Candidatus Raymondbacteria bacterium RIFOXYD12_FULL_49_13 TaxID=1817890 RepID=A0A1F7F930_UNCRA|nr:MAG: arginine--tRNA ligase [Candidatus Raymondbacteria bacterium RIFOXYA2_FULL_49_16]OGJ90726.1 MAG: arginine--tRNA ligase [Candidatus Raymondbacteria bacterium RifOxyA12_full_50_37]OGJ91704.1 MAG: arginine--tRNA ligase [Candidatus Raymondbacteria bacterium RifOxyB12_full_50_8]OGJ98363.1 MAG: arginine--tRNA ligase [Candidatus Raymondbacteria bacterium RIFOXYC2_FULL_50_21]OGK03088.1 MAG: arginine--tRNA ligase [Candidatus Raymondbacteria bacterium RIFOXYD12_FULL_49_13]OGK06626.1 MAG: arginine
MIPLADELALLVTEALNTAFSNTVVTGLEVKKTTDPKFGDYQTECAMTLARSLKKNPLDIAGTIAAAIKTDGPIEKAEAVRPGFINLTIRTEFLEKKAKECVAGLAEYARQRLSGTRIVIDYSSPNIAKTMHIGHFRATIVGNALYRILKFLGAGIISDNHLGDWGTQFGKLIVAYSLWKDDTAYAKNPIGELERLYQKFEKEKTPDLEERARQELVKLQQGDMANTSLWQEFISHSMAEFNRIYARLNIVFDHTYGESHYNSMLAEVVESLLQKNIAHHDQGAVIIDTDNRYKIHGPVIVRKKDGGFSYATTDLATIKFRIDTWAPERIIYVTDSRQQDHFKSIFAVAGEWLGLNATKPEHVWFGSIKASDGKTFSTREGNVIFLRELMDEAVQRARTVVEEKNPTLSQDEKTAIAEAVGIGALKYAELNHDLKTDTTFNWEKMLSFDGNTAPYHLYTYARIKSVLRKYEEINGPLPVSMPIRITNETERNLVLLADSFSGKMMYAARDLKPNHVTEYMHTLAREFNAYYNREDSVVVKEPDKAKRESRAAIYSMVSELLKACLTILGITPLERM